MLRKVLNTLLKKDYKDIVFTYEINGAINNEDINYINNNFNVNTIKDIRSATFYALGKENLHAKTIVIINGEELQNTLTGITETWFQRLNVFIIALYEKYDNIKTDFIYRVIPNIVKIYEDDYFQYEEKILKSANSCMPSLITLKYGFEKVEYSYNKLINELKNVLKKEDELVLYEPKELEKTNEFKIKNIESKYKYGILSKYMGYVCGKNKKILLCMPASLTLLELNIFNNRYINENFKLILFNCSKVKQEEMMTKWINSNKIKTNVINTLNKDILEKFWNSKEPMVLLIKGEI